ncbi:MAG: hypothetical protein ACREOU_09000 [Candidatus Eiseniibacteriota bacterium]
MKRGRAMRGGLGLLVLLGFTTGITAPAWPRVYPESGDEATPINGAGSSGARGPMGPMAVPEINGPGRVSTVGNVYMKTTNIGVLGNPFTANSSDPSGQWPGPSGVEYLFFIGLWIAAKNPEAQDPALLRRVSHNTEWRPPTLAPEDRIYQSYDGQVNGARDFNDDGDSDAQGAKVDEEFLNGRDDDFDGAPDEDYAAISQQMFACEIRDDTEQAVNANFAEKHVPFGLLVRQSTYAFAVPGSNDFTAANFEVINQSGHTLDSVFVGFFVEQDVGPVQTDRYFSDDLPDPRVPQGDFFEPLDSRDPRFNPVLCPNDTIHVRGFSMVDDEGDMGRTIGGSSFLLLGHTTDPTGVKGPRRVGFRMYKAYLPGTPYAQGGVPTVDIERFEAMAQGGPNVDPGIDPVTGLISIERPDESTKNDYFSLCSVGPFLQFENGETIEVQIALAVQRCDYSKPLDDPVNPSMPNPDRYRAMIDNAIEAQKTFRGAYVAPPTGFSTPDSTGRETGLTAPLGEEFELADCRDDEAGTTRTVHDDQVTWFDLDCNFCTGVRGLLLRNWVAAAPPPNPALRLTPADQRVILEWDNLSETTTDPSSGEYDIKRYRVWKASNYTRPVGSSGPGEELWALLAEFTLYDQLSPLIDSVDTSVPADGTFDTLGTVAPVLLNIQSGQRIYPYDIAPCGEGSALVNGTCVDPADPNGPPLLANPPAVDTLFSNPAPRRYLDYSTGLRTPTPRVDPTWRVPKYPIGRYKFEDPQVLNGFIYFYSVTAKDSSGQRSADGGRGTLAEQEGRRSATEDQGVIPQSAAAASRGDVYVVPNPYRGRSQWDLTPSASDPTGTHVDFFNLPAGEWTLRIFTISGDLVVTIHSDDVQPNGKPQQENAEDGQATWNLISRNGQDVVSGIYMFSVEAGGETSQGKFVIIR